MATRGTGLARRGGDLTAFDPFNEIQDMRRTMDDLFSRFFGYTPMNRLVGGAPEGWGWQPNVDLWETEEELAFRADLPGFDRDDIDLKVTQDTLQISAQHRGDEGGQPSAGDAGSRNDPADTQGNTQATAQGSAQSQPRADQGSPSDGSTGSKAVQTAQPQHPRTYHIRGQQRRSFAVSYTLPKEIDPNRVSAQFTQGVLEVHMPKPEQSRPKQVQVDVKG